MPRHDCTINPNSLLKELEKINSMARLSMRVFDLYRTLSAETGRETFYIYVTSKNVTFVLKIHYVWVFCVCVCVCYFGLRTSPVMKLHFFFIWILLCFNVATMSATHKKDKNITYKKLYFYKPAIKLPFRTVYESWKDYDYFHAAERWRSFHILDSAVTLITVFQSIYPALIEFEHVWMSMPPKTWIQFFKWEFEEVYALIKVSLCMCMSVCGAH